MKAISSMASALLVAAGLSACGTSAGYAPIPDRPPTAAEIAKTLATEEAGWTTVGELTAGYNKRNQASYTPAEFYVLTGYDKADRACDEFFVRIKTLRSETTFTKDTLVAAGAAAGVVASIVSAGTTALTTLFGATGLVPSAVDNFNKLFLLSEIADDIAPKISTAMAEYRTKNPVKGTDRITAVDRVREHAQACTIPFMIHLAKTGTANTKVEVKDTTGGNTQPPAAPALAGQRQNRPPAPAQNQRQLSTFGRYGISTN